MVDQGGILALDKKLKTELAQPVVGELDETNLATFQQVCTRRSQAPLTLLQLEVKVFNFDESFIGRYCCFQETPGVPAEALLPVKQLDQLQQEWLLVDTLRTPEIPLEIEPRFLLQLSLLL